MLQQPADYTPTGPMSSLSAQVENQWPETSFQVSKIIKRDSWYWEMFSNFCLPALLMVLFVEDDVWINRFLWAIILRLSFSKARQALQLLQKLWTAGLLSHKHIFALKGQVFTYPFSLLAFIITECIEDAVWKKRFMWAVMHLVIVHLTMQVWQVHLEPIEKALEPILKDFMSKQLPWYMSTRPIVMLAVDVEYQSSRTSFGILQVPFFYFAFHSMEYYNHSWKDRHVWAMILVFTFYTGRQAFRLAHELLATMHLSQRCALMDNQSSQMRVKVSGFIWRGMREYFINKGLLNFKILDMPLSLMAFIIIGWMDDGNWKDRYLGVIMSPLWLSTIFQLVHLFLAILAILHFLKQRGSPLTSLASDLPSMTFTESKITHLSSSSNLPNIASTTSTTTLMEPTTTQRASLSNLPSTSSIESVFTQKASLSNLPSMSLMASMITSTASTINQRASMSTLHSASLTRSTISQKDFSSYLPSMSSMASMITQEASLTSRPKLTYDVFLSFYGEDCRKNFVDHLYIALKQKGILVYKDNENLERGKDISLELLEAIQKSEYTVVVISRNYAFSKWCLMELTHIVKSMIATQLTILPVFYHVDPSHVRNQIGSFANAFDKHMKDVKVAEKERKAWRVALEKVGGLAGWHIYDRYEAEVVKEICRTIFIRLCGNLSNFSHNLVGMKSRVENMITLLEIDGVNFIGICGIAGVGKTTLAKFIYNRFSSEFEASSFIYVKEGTQNEVDLQRQLISEILKESGIEVLDACERLRILRKVCNKKVLIVFDNVEEEAQIKEFVWRKDLHHQESRILITSKNRKLLKRYVDKIYDVEELNDSDALQLFSWMAFKKSHPDENHLKMSHDLVRYAGGIPLAIEIFGSSLFDEPMDVWESALDNFKSHPQAKIIDKLEISLKGLEVVQKEIFLDVIFFFNGSLESEVIDILNGCDYYPAFNISVLRNKCLVKSLEEKTIHVHDLLVITGQQIVKNESLRDPGKRSRLNHQVDIISVMKKNTETNVVEGIVLELPLKKKEQVSLETFSKMTNLRILLIKNKSCYVGDSSEFLEDLQTLEWQKDPSNFNLSHKLCVITWWRYPLQSLPSSFESNCLVKLQMPYSCIKKLWEGTKSFGKLKEIDLTYSRNLIETPDFSGAPNLEKLVFSFCSSLSKVHSSIRLLKRLQVLKLEGCNYIQELSESEKGWEFLEEIDIRGTAIKKLPSIVFSTKLKILNVGGNESNPTSFFFPRSFFGFSSLSKISMIYCNISDDMTLNSLVYSPSLESLDLTGNKFSRIPDSISQLSKLDRLVLDNCSSLQVPPKLPWKLLGLSVRNCPSLKKFYSQMDAGTSSEMLLSGDFSSLATYVGYGGKPYMNVYMHPQDTFRYGRFRTGVSWGVARGPQIPSWFNQRRKNSSGTIQTQIKVDESTIWDGYGLFIAYEVDELDSCQIETKNQNVREYESSNSGTHNGSNPIFPEFACRLQVKEWKNSRFRIKKALKLKLNKGGPVRYREFENSRFRTKKASKLKLIKGGPVRTEKPGLSFVFRIPEVVPVGLNGLWVLIDWNFLAKVNTSTETDCLGVSIASKSPNVKVKECGVRLVPDYHDSEFQQAVKSISAQSLDEMSHLLSLPCTMSMGSLEENVEV